ncbi:hypothetical protein ACFW6E_09075 [Streptomyces olivaceoviridis]|uniref:hypothetical protein n=1 Tax=Streptomyces olivaceoviridis TaxID=1921 RepID=UPI0036B4449C
MAVYVITGKNGSGEPLVSVQISAINQEGPVIQELDAVNALRTFLAGVAGVQFVVAQKYEQVITTV